MTSIKRIDSATANEELGRLFGEFLEYRRLFTKLPESECLLPLEDPAIQAQFDNIYHSVNTRLHKILKSAALERWPTILSATGRLSPSQQRQIIMQKNKQGRNILMIISHIKDADERKQMLEPLMDLILKLPSEDREQLIREVGHDYHQYDNKVMSQDFVVPLLESYLLQRQDEAHTENSNRFSFFRFTSKDKLIAASQLLKAVQSDPEPERLMIAAKHKGACKNGRLGALWRLTDVGFSTLGNYTERPQNLVIEL